MYRVWEFNGMAVSGMFVSNRRHRLAVKRLRAHVLSVRLPDHDILRSFHIPRMLGEVRAPQGRLLLIQRMDRTPCRVEELTERAVPRAVLVSPSCESVHAVLGNG